MNWPPSCTLGRRRIEEPERADLSGRDRPDLDRDPKGRAGAAAGLRRRRRQGRLRRPHADDGGGPDLPASRGRPAGLELRHPRTDRGDHRPASSRPCRRRTSSSTPPARRSNTSTARCRTATSISSSTNPSQTQTRTATLAGSGRAEVWDAASGTIHPLDGAKAAAGSVAVPLKLAGHEARFIVLRR